MQSFDFFQMKCCAKYDFLEIYEIFNIANSTNRSSYPEVFLGKGVWKCEENLLQNIFSQEHLWAAASVQIWAAKCDSGQDNKF